LVRGASGNVILEMVHWWRADCCGQAEETTAGWGVPQLHLVCEKMSISTLVASVRAELGRLRSWRVVGGSVEAINWALGQKGICCLLITAGIVIIFMRRRRKQKRRLTGRELPRLCTEVPGPSSRALIDKLACHECPAITARRARRTDKLGAAATDPIVWEEARGCVIRDVDNNLYVDVTSGFGVATLGHGAPEVCKAAIAQLQKPMIHAMGDAFPDAGRIELLQELTTFLPGLPKGILGCSGADAVQAALKTAALKTGKSGVLAFTGSYHGLAHGALALSAYNARHFREPFKSQLGAHVQFVPFAMLPPFGRYWGSNC